MDPHCTPPLLDALDNGSVAAFLGAFFAFLLVVITDRLRRRNKLKRLRRLINDNKEHAKRKRESSETNIALMREGNRFVSSPVMPFSTDTIRHLRLEVIDLIASDENRCIDALIYWMEAIDELFRQIHAESERLRALVREGAENKARLNCAEFILTNYQEAAVNLKHFQTMCEAFERTAFAEILELKLVIR